MMMLCCIPVRCPYRLRRAAPEASDVSSETARGLIRLVGLISAEMVGDGQVLRLWSRRYETGGGEGRLRRGFSWRWRAGGVVASVGLWIRIRGCGCDWRRLLIEVERLRKGKGGCLTNVRGALDSVLRFAVAKGRVRMVIVWGRASHRVHRARQRKNSGGSRCK
ncbi:hypothetical protein B0T11DRAFT_276074 [Plectosphaerella cucumerina]|uniref:Uncharacterized protein n=1 Tax=Plectosphaerella cucumerina TaxID=40658 RepID=A0A8K0TLN8_9PEZI|nr:hypothetical protein B0T11DRAFT_276074 [Plectosphaerella cucumerina]